jgi:hypothetical protein
MHYMEDVAGQKWALRKRGRLMPAAEGAAAPHFLLRRKGHHSARGGMLALYTPKDARLCSSLDEPLQKGKPITSKEVKYHDLTPFQREIAVQRINSRYRNFYVCYFDVEKANKTMVSGKHEQLIQMRMVHSILAKLDKRELSKYEKVCVIMDKKLSDHFRDLIEEEFQKHLGTKKGITVDTEVSSRERGLQVADLIAGAFRAKLMKKSDLFEVELTRIFQIVAPDEETFRAEKAKV